MNASPKWRRQKETRPGDIVRAALDVFSEKGFAGAKMEEIAARAGVSKGAPYLYFPTKEDLFAAVVREAVEPNIDPIILLAQSHEGPLEPVLRAMTQRIAFVAETTSIGRVVKLVITLATLIERAQQRGEVRPGDPRAHAITIISPLLLGVVFRETFVPIGAKPFDLPALMQQHLDTVLPGLLLKRETP